MTKQGFALGPLLFLIYINGLPDELTSLRKTFADDTYGSSLYCRHKLTAVFE